MAPVSSRGRFAGRPSSPYPVLAIGRRVFVNCRGDGGSVPLTDENGAPTRATLADGVEVEVLAWRPRGASGTRYRIRAGTDGADGWVQAKDLRTTSAPAPADETPAPAEPAAPAADADHGARRFGQRAWPRR